MRIYVVIITLICSFYIQATPLPAGAKLVREKLNPSLLRNQNDMSNKSHVNMEPRLFKAQSQYLKKIQTAGGFTQITHTSPDHPPSSPPGCQTFWSIEGFTLFPGLQNMSKRKEQKDEGYASWLCSPGTNSKVRAKAVTHGPAIIDMRSRDQFNVLQINHRPLQQLDSSHVKIQRTPKTGIKILTKRSDQPTSTTPVQEHINKDPNKHLSDDDIAVILSLVGFISLAILIWCFGNKLKQIPAFWKK